MQCVYFILNHSIMSYKKRDCMFGEGCYRRNPDHFKEFNHPPQLLEKIQSLNDDILVKSEVDDDFQNFELSSKRVKLTTDFGNENNLPDEIISNQFGFFLTKVSGIDSKFNKIDNQRSVSSIGIKDILNESTGKLVESAQFSYIFDLDWLIEQYPKNWRKCPLYIVFGKKSRNDEQDLLQQSKRHSQVALCPVTISDPFGTHHTKMMLLHFEQGLRIVIHTANLVSGDWDLKTQGIWISPIFPLLIKSPNETDETNFKKDLLQYLDAYELSHLKYWSSVINKHNLSSANVFLVSSIPGRHKNENRSSFGHMKLRKVLSGQFGAVSRNSTWPVVCQFSSIGSLGPEANKWLTSQFLTSLASFEEISFEKPDLKCIFPTVENVRNSLEGYMAGSSLPYFSKTARKQQYLNAFFHQWKANSTGRSEASPHIKSYCRLSPNNEEISWFLLTSANLSKAAWGELQINGSQLAIRSYELGVLFLPKLLNGTDSFMIQSTQDRKKFFPLPYDAPLTKYSSNDKPWMWDLWYVEKPDRHGNSWNPEF